MFKIIFNFFSTLILILLAQKYFNSFLTQIKAGLELLVKKVVTSLENLMLLNPPVEAHLFVCPLVEYQHPLTIPSSRMNVNLKNSFVYQMVKKDVSF